MAVNLSTTGVPTGSTNAALFDGNVLGNYNAPTYHLRLYTKPDSFANSTGSATTTGITIAESGVTGYNIKELTVEAVVSGNEKTRNVQSTKYHFVINEPQGTSFMDAMLAAVYSQSVQNWQKCLYFLDISFKGYEEDGSTNPNLCSNFPNGGIWTQYLYITNVEAETTATGTSYAITANAQNVSVLYPSTIRLSTPITVEAATLGEFLDNFASYLNTVTKTNYSTQLINYSFDLKTTPDKVDPRTFTFIADGDPLQPFRSKGFTTNNRGKISANLTVGQAITDIIQSAIGATIQGHVYAVNATGQDTGDTGNGAYRAAGIFMVHPEVQQTGYDNTSQNYISNVIFHVKMFKTQATLLQTTEVTNTDSGTKALTDIQSYGGLRKRYEYIYTGLNTEVIEFSTKFNFSWQTLLPSFDGYLTTTANYEPHAEYNPLQKGSIATLSANISAESATASSVAAATGTTSNATPSALGGSIQVVANTGGTAAQATGFNLSGAATTTGNVASTTATTAQYAENLIDTQRNSNPFTVSLGKTGPAIQNIAGTGFTTRVDRRRSVFAALLNQFYINQASLVINIKIKGDPFWLGMDYLLMIGSSLVTAPTTNTATNSNSTANNSISGGALLPDYSSGDNCFCLYYRFPYTTDESGMPILKDNMTFNGVYRVINITSSFSGGLFTQTLKANRVTSITPAQSNTHATSTTGPTPSS